MKASRPQSEILFYSAAYRKRPLHPIALCGGGRTGSGFYGLRRCFLYFNVFPALLRAKPALWQARSIYNYMLFIDIFYPPPARRGAKRFTCLFILCIFMPIPVLFSKPAF